LKYGFKRRYKNGDKEPYYQCKNAEDHKKYWFESELGRTTNVIPNILLLDIETAPIDAYVWSLWKQNVYIDQIISNWFMLTWSAKWLFDDKVMAQRLTPEEVELEDDKRITKKLWNLLNKADIVIAHNGDKFDIPKILSRCIVNDIKPPTPYQSIDTCKVARKQFGFSSNKLDALATEFGFENKIDTDFNLWKRCRRGEKKALKEMEEYNRYDVVLLEEVYLKLRPYIKSHPNLGLYNDVVTPQCGNCGSENIEWKGDYYFTPAGKYKAFICECGAVNRTKFNELGTRKNKTLLRSTAR